MPKRVLLSIFFRTMRGCVVLATMGILLIYGLAFNGLEPKQTAGWVLAFVGLACTCWAGFVLTEHK
jgi:threonine/homoserine efflux transporter RhtA